MLEALSTGCLIVGSSTAPVQEAIADGVNGLLADFFDPEDIADKVETALDNLQDMARLRANARDTILQRYDLATLLPQQMAWLLGEAPAQSATHPVAS
ncbi:MAG: glycosyltransferase [Cyanobacteria bacterium P01_F01_bin.56]